MIVTKKRVLLLAALGMAACCCTANLSPERCVLSSPPSAGIPRLYRQANWRTQTLPVVTKPLCTDEGRPIEDECETVDDLGALLGNGVACGPSGQAVQHVCPNFSERVAKTPPSVETRPCGAAACPNVQIEIREESGSVTRVLFYDDPACHAPAPDPKCADAKHDCYYRVLAVSTELAGKET